MARLIMYKDLWGLVEILVEAFEGGREDKNKNGTGTGISVTGIDVSSLFHRLVKIGSIWVKH